MVKRALLVGINYKNTPYQLNGCINDVNNMAEFLKRSLGYENKNIVMLTDDTLVKPTIANILKGFNLLINLLQSGDEVFFHYSGHGLRIPDYNRDEESGYDSAIAPIDFTSRGFISDDVIRTNLIQKVPRGAKLYVILDACHSGTGCDLRYKYDDSSYLQQNASVLPATYVPSEWALKQTTYEFKKYNKTVGEVYCISGCQDHETSADAYIQNEKTFNGALTYILLSLIKSNDVRSLKWKHLLKDICCNEKVQGYTQRTAITSGNPLNMESAVFTLLPLVAAPVKASITPLKKSKVTIKNKNIIMKKIFFMK
jgi:hypothetical protein